MRRLARENVDISSPECHHAPKMNPHAISSVSIPAKSRGIRPIEDDSPVDCSFLLAVSRAFLAAVGAHDRNGTVLYSRAMLSIMNRGKDC